MNNEQPPLILILDDDDSIRTLLKLAIKNQGYRVQEARNGEEGIAVYQCCQPDLVILDAMMPVMDGFTCCENLRNINQEIPILMLTFLNDRDSIDKAFQAGATDYITKPIYWGVLFQRVRRLLLASEQNIQGKKIYSELLKLKNYEYLLSSILHSTEPIINEDILEKIRLFFEVDLALFYSVKTKSVLQVYDQNFSIIEEMEDIEDLTLLSHCDSIYKQEQLLIIDDLKNSNLDQDISPENFMKIEEIFTQFELKSLAIAPIKQKQQLSNLLCLYQIQKNHIWEESEKRRIIDLTQLLALKK